MDWEAWQKTMLLEMEESFEEEDILDTDDNRVVYLLGFQKGLQACKKFAIMQRDIAKLKIDLDKFEKQE